MRFKTESFNDGKEVIENEFEDEVQEIREALKEAEYHVKKCFQENREDETIFDPVGTNAIIKEKLKERGWDAGVGFEADHYSAGTDIDFWKNGVGVEVQFSHYTSLDSDMNRLQRLYDGILDLEGDRDVDAAILVVVEQGMPTSQSVAHFQQAVKRAGPTIPSIPTLMFGLEEPEKGEEVKYCVYPKPRSRTIEEEKEIRYTGKIPEEEQKKLDSV